MLQENKIINMDCLEGIRQLPDECIDMIITSPPYFVGKDYNEGADYSEFNNVVGEWETFSDWLVDMFKQCKRVLKPSGKLAINIDDRHVGLKTFGKNITLSTHAKLIVGLKDSFDYKEMILWRKIRAKKTSGGAGMMMGSFGRYGSPGEIPILQEVEYILLFRKDGNREGVTDFMRKESALTKDEFSKYGMQIWDVFPETNRIHPAPFPVEIPYRLIKLFTFKGDIILDTFMGSGTTAIAAVGTERKYIGFELEKEFCDIANERIESFIKNGQDSTYMKINSMFSRKRDKKTKTSNIF
jgi:DNA modification methylase